MIRVGMKKLARFTQSTLVTGRRSERNVHLLKDFFFERANRLFALPWAIGQGQESFE